MEGTKHILSWGLKAIYYEKVQVLMNVYMRKVLTVLLAGMAASAAYGGFDLAFNDARWMKLPLEPMTGFHSFLIPGLILFFVIGGTNLVAAIAVAKKYRWADLSSFVAGLGLMIWFFTELYLFRGTHPVQVVYFAWSVAILALTFGVMRRV